MTTLFSLAQTGLKREGTNRFNKHRQTDPDSPSDRNKTNQPSDCGRDPDSLR